jgi:hypothetical protein
MPIFSWVDQRLIKSGVVADYWDLGCSMFFSIVDSIHTCSSIADFWLRGLHSSGFIFFKLNLLMTDVNFIELVSSWCWLIWSFPNADFFGVLCYVPLIYFQSMLVVDLISKKLISGWFDLFKAS